jgi:hypothetical protein
LLQKGEFSLRVIFAEILLVSVYCGRANREAPSTSSGQEEEAPPAPSTSSGQEEETPQAPSNSSGQEEKVPQAPSTSGQEEKVPQAPSPPPGRKRRCPRPPRQDMETMSCEECDGKGKRGILPYSRIMKKRGRKVSQLIIVCAGFVVSFIIPTSHWLCGCHLTVSCQFTVQ